MKGRSLALWSALLLTGCGNNEGVRAFERYFGDYTVLLAPGQPSYDSCPITDATLRTEKFEGHDAVVLDAKGARSTADGVDCQSTMKTLLVVSGMKDTPCKTAEGYARCERNGESFESVITENGREVRLDLKNSDGTSKVQTWVLRRK